MEDEESKMSPVESSNPGNIARTSSSTHSQHHVHFSDQVPTQESSNHSQSSNKSPVKPSVTSILSKPSHLPVQNSYPEDTVTISGNLSDVDSPGKDDDDNQYCEETEYDDCTVGPESDNIILGEPILYTGDPSVFRYWFPVVHMDERLREFPGCHPDIDEKRVTCSISIIRVQWFCIYLIFCATFIGLNRITPKKQSQTCVVCCRSSVSSRNKKIMKAITSYGTVENGACW